VLWGLLRCLARRFLASVFSGASTLAAPGTPGRLWEERWALRLLQGLQLSRCLVEVAQTDYE